MSCLNIGWWNSSKLHTFKIYNLRPNDMVISAKMKIMDMMRISEVEKLDLIYCGSVMENMEKLSSYVEDINSLVFMIKKEDGNTDTDETFTEANLQRILKKFNEVYVKTGFKEIVLNYMKPETVAELVEAIPELSKDLVAQSIVKDFNLFESILKPSVLKKQLTKHPSLLIAVEYLIHKLMKRINGRLRSSMHLADDDYSESDDIEIDYNQPNVSTFGPSSIPELAFLFRNDDEGDIQTFGPSSIFEDIFMDVDQRVDDDQQIDNSSLGLSSQLHQMHELGLFDDLLNYRALQISGGNVQHAVELILNRVID